MFRKFLEDKMASIAFDADKGAGSGGSSDDDDKDTDKKRKTGDASGGENQNGGDGEDTITLSKSDLQKRIDDTLKERLERERKKNEAALKKTKEDADAAALEANQEFKVLAEKRQTKIQELEQRLTELDAVTNERDQYKDALVARLASDKEGLPTHIIALLDRLSPLEQIDYLNKNSKALRSQQSVGGPPASPAGNNDKNLSEKDLAAAAGKQANWVRNRF